MMDMNFMLELVGNGSVTVPSLLIENYHGIGLNEQECMLLVQIHSFLSKGDDFPTFDDLASRMSFDETACADCLRSLIQRGYLAIIQKNDRKLYSEAYSLEPLWNKLIRAAYSKRVSKVSTENDDKLYTLFENEFARPLSPIECETLAMWLDQDHHSPSLIKGALREAVLSGKMNFRYIDRILFDWKKNGIKTLDQAKKHGEKIRAHQHRNTVTKQEKSDVPKMPTYNWLGKLD
ncbi:DNA replication protein DnaD [Sporolactobacillus terrae]|uniref:DNA replication protein DnaD n=2 Tax=Sporolactobacillus terrae TaxID=269673 RepID=A0A5K7WWC5_9BACL|nr:DNA replication protein DnaD [Sporolactobacillus terrae]